ncbi:MATE family efflux transporter [uncultured Sphaerochaeta sp.]|uniref:MATE family efflux transporter n=1 Tax=uncultured Sphaerochaeta sp. TaxID=886478 RepID=UPI002A0A9A8A|nr:MATE family efflux transporter [uncultured Sphaerochaeta sp.]
MNQDRIKILAETPVRKAILVMSLPVVMGMMVQVFYNLADTFFIGRLGDTNQLAAANISLPVFIFSMAMAGIIGTGAASYISRALGEKNNKEADKTLTIGMIYLIIISIVATAFTLLFLDKLVSILGASKETFPFAHAYVLVLVWGILPIMSNFALGQLLRAEGDAMGSMFGMLIGTVTNILLDPLFIFIFSLGVGGAALATVLANIASLLFYILRYRRGKTLLHFSLKEFSFDKKISKEIFTIGIPASLGQGLMSVALIVMNNIAASYGDSVVAGLGVASRIITIGTFIFMGIGAGSQPLVGYNYGARNFSRVKSIILNGIGLTTAIGLVLGILMWIFAYPFISTFTSVDKVISYGITVLRALVLSLPIMGGQMLCTISVQAMGKVLPSLFLSISRQGLLFIPLLLLLNLLFGFNGFIYAQPITDAIMLILSFSILQRILKKEEINH